MEKLKRRKRLQRNLKMPQRGDSQLVQLFKGEGRSFQLLYIIIMTHALTWLMLTVIHDCSKINIHSSMYLFGCA